MLSKTTLAVVLCARAASAQLTPDVEAKLDSMARTFVRLAAEQGQSLWPGFRPDTTPVALVLRNGTLLFNWTGALPPRFRQTGIARSGWSDSADAGAASTAVRIQRRNVAQLVVRELDPVAIIPGIFHEAFHVFLNAQRKEGRRFGAGENSFYVASYPVFDGTNEALFTIETLILAAALESASIGERKELARQFVATRRQRHRRLSPEYAEFDRASEMNEGLAEYILVRAIDVMAAESAVPAAWRATAARAETRRVSQLRGATADSSLSLRIRYYHTGPAIGRLLDQMAPNWKARLMEENLALEDLLAESSGLDDPQRAAFRSALSRFDSSRTAQQAAERIASLRRRRMRLVDSVLALPGFLLVVRADSLPSRGFNMCGLDPQNLLQVTERVRLQTRWWRPCSGGPTYADLNVPSVHDAERGTISAVIGDHGVSITSNGSPVALPADGQTLRNLTTFKLTAPRVSVEAVRADVERLGRTLVVWAKGS